MNKLTSRNVSTHLKSFFISNRPSPVTFQEVKIAHCPFKLPRLERDKSPTILMNSYHG